VKLVRAKKVCKAKCTFRGTDLGTEWFIDVTFSKRKGLFNSDIVNITRRCVGSSTITARYADDGKYIPSELSNSICLFIGSDKNEIEFTI
jgi:hypothetical protein